jgi:hypothetical protein
MAATMEGMMALLRNYTEAAKTQLTSTLV